ncbi:tail fiber assembly protein [Morganella morganii]|uniref:tail fiber assembly protein n=1 Tax=Morganella morganii TaxID=582 RepID=UPI000469BAFD|nr:tail fiber assembly protein [Morganella morganii]
MKIFNYHPVTKEYLSEGLADADPMVEGNWLIPAYATTVNPPEIKPWYIPVFDGEQWMQKADYRGTKVYDIITAQESEIKELGELPDGVTTIAPDVEFPKWNGKKWVMDKAEKKESDIAAAEAQKQYLIAEVHTETQMLQTKLALDRIKDDEKARLNAWLDYLDELEAVDVSTAPDIIWPVNPAV